MVMKSIFVHNSDFFLKTTGIHFDCKFIWYKEVYILSKIHLKHSVNLLLAAVSSQTCDGVKPIFNRNC